MRIEGTNVKTTQTPTDLEPVAVYEAVGYDANGNVVWRGITKVLYKSVADYLDACKKGDLRDSIRFVHRTDLPEFDWEREPTETRFISSKNL